MAILSPYSLFILCNRYMEAKVFSANNIVKTGCVYISDQLSLRKIVLIRTTMLLYNMTLYSFWLINFVFVCQV